MYTTNESKYIKVHEVTNIQDRYNQLDENTLKETYEKYNSYEAKNILNEAYEVNELNITEEYNTVAHRYIKNNNLHISNKIQDTIFEKENKSYDDFYNDALSIANNIPPDVGNLLLPTLTANILILKNVLESTNKMLLQVTQERDLYEEGLKEYKIVEDINIEIDQLIQTKELLLSKRMSYYNHMNKRYYNN
jgi:hypothetical protein